jgi:geranylgeranyl pyrophosphate synthase
MARAPEALDAETSARKLRVIRLVAEAAGPAGMVAGQVLDLHGSSATASSDAAELRAMHAKKTGALIRASAVAGAIMGAGRETVIVAIDEAATEFGLAFQIIDDVLDIEGAASTLGKTPGKDAAAGKATYPALYGIDGARRMAAACVDRAEALLAQAGIGNSPLARIGRWIVSRSH